MSIVALDCLGCDGSYVVAYSDRLGTVGGASGFFRNSPVLRCPDCGGEVVPEPVRMAQEEALAQARQAGASSPVFSIDLRSLAPETIATAAQFLYDPVDYLLIPGLWRPWGDNYLTPVFFSIGVLTKYTASSEYRVELGANTYGSILKRDEPLLDFGINRQGLVVMWLGDIAELAESEQYYLRSCNVESDHDVASEFYRGQIACEFSPPSTENSLLDLRSQVNNKALSRFGVVLCRLQVEALEEARRIVRPVEYTTESVLAALTRLYKVCGESISGVDLRNDILSLEPEAAVEKLGSLKLLEKWLQIRLGIPSAASMVAPLFILYDLRLVDSHLFSDEGRKSKLASACTRLGLAEGTQDHRLIYEAVVGAMCVMYQEVLNVIERNR